MRSFTQKIMNETISLILCFGLPCLMTTLGATLIFFFKKVSDKLNVITMGLASGIMISASIWSLLLPALENAETSWGGLKFIPIVCGFLIGGIFMSILDFCTSKLTKTNSIDKNFAKNRQKALKFFTAITVHNIPEGLSVGLALGCATISHTSLTGAVMFAVGIAIQNFPEGLATALPIQNYVNSRKKSFFLAFLSGIVEPLFAVAGYFLASHLHSLMPWLLTFSASAIIYVILHELLPETYNSGKITLSTWAFFIGFVIMMILDICL